jgi:hypothetical protein
MTWKRTVKEEANEGGKNWSEIKRLPTNRKG